MIANFLLMLTSSLVKGGVFCLILNLNRRFSLIVKSGEKYFLVLGMLCFVLLPLGVPYLKTEFKAFDNKIAADPKNITVPAITPPLAASSPKLPPIAETSKSTAVLSAVVSGDNVSASSIPLTTQQVKSGAHEPKVVADVSVPEVEVTAATEIAVPANEAAAESGFFWRNIYLFYLYLGVSLGWLVMKGVRIFYVARILRRLPQLSDVSLLDLGRKFAIPVNAMYNGDNYCETPAGCGIFRKTFLLPQSRLINCSVSEISWLLAHEKAHFNHYDNVVKFIIYWLEALMWFNPFFFMLRRQLFNLMEQRCDEKVVSEFGLERGERVAYSKLLSNFALGRNIILTNNLSNNGKSFLERINAIMMEYTLPSRRILLSELLIACATVAVLMPFISRADKSMDGQISSDATYNPEAFGVHRGGGELLNFVERNWSESKAAGLNWLNDFYTVAVLDSWRNHLQKSLDGAKYKAEKGLASYADFEQVEYKLMLLDCRYPSSNTAYLKAVNRCRDILLQRLTARKRGSANPDEVEQAEKKLLCFEIAFEYHKDAEARLAAINQLYKIFERRLESTKRRFNAGDGTYCELWQCENNLLFLDMNYLHPEPSEARSAVINKIHQNFKRIFEDKKLQFNAGSLASDELWQAEYELLLFEIKYVYLENSDARAETIKKIIANLKLNVSDNETRFELGYVGHYDLLKAKNKQLQFELEFIYPQVGDQRLAAIRSIHNNLQNMLEFSRIIVGNNEDYNLLKQKDELYQFKLKFKPEIAAFCSLSAQ